jgi:hypothetical protein
VSTSATGTVESDIFSEPFLLTPAAARGDPRRGADRAAQDEVDRAEIETEALLLDAVRLQISIPSSAPSRASNDRWCSSRPTTAEPSEALKRRCLYLHIDYPELDREGHRARRVPEIDEALAEQIAKVVGSIRNPISEGALDLRDDRLGPYPALPRS